MACPFKFVLVFIIPVIASGCITLRMEKFNIGNAVPASIELKENQSTLLDALTFCGAPREIVDLEGGTVLVYQKDFYKAAELGLGLPFSFQSLSGVGVNLSGYGGLWKYDRLVLFFSPDWVLMSKVYVKGSEEPFFKTLFRDKGSGK